MDTLQVVLLSILGFTACLTFLWMASLDPIRWRRVAFSLVAALGLMLQGAIWGYITVMFKALSVGGSYMWLYAALVTSVAGTVWALALLGSTLICRQSID